MVYSFLKGVLQVKIYCDVHLLKKSMLMSKFLLLHVPKESVSKLKNKKPNVSRIVLFRCAGEQHVKYQHNKVILQNHHHLFITRSVTSTNGW